MNEGFIDYTKETLAAEEHERRRNITNKLKHLKEVYSIFQTRIDREFTQNRALIRRAWYRRGFHRTLMSDLARRLRLWLIDYDESKRKYIEALEDFGTNQFVPLQPLAKRKQYLLFMRRYTLFKSQFYTFNLRRTTATYR